MVQKLHIVKYKFVQSLILIKNTVKLLVGLFLLSLATKGYSQCGGIDFTASQTSACAPELIKFYGQNIPQGSTITWDYGFGDNLGKDTGQNIYTAPGTYTVVLKVTLSDGVTTCNVSKPNYVTIINKPTPSFSVSRRVLCDGPDSVTITDNSTGGNGRNWIIDGLPISDTSKTIVHTFTSVGFKDILLILNSNTCATTFHRVDSAVRIYEQLEIDFTSDITSGCIPASVDFTPIVKTNGHTVANYNWSFAGGNPTTSTTFNPTISYASAGEYDVDLTITNTDGCTASTSKVDYIVMGDTNNFTVIPSKSSICRSEIINLDISDPTLQGDFTWDLGNGVPQAGSTPKQQIVQFNDTGKQFYKVYRDYNGCKMERTYTDDVYVRPPIAQFTILNSVECEEDARIFVFNTSKPDPTTTNSYRWNLYDPNGNLLNTSTDSIPNFRTNGFGQYSLQLIVTTPAGCSDQITRTEIFRRTGVGNFIIRPEASCPGGTVNFISTSSAFSSAEPNIYQWTIYDTNGVTVLHSENSGILPQLSYSFNNVGTYSVGLVVYNSKCRDTVKVNKTVDIVSPSTTITVSDSFPCVKTPVTFSANTTPAIAAPGYEYRWILENATDTSRKFIGDSATTTLTPDTAGEYNLKTVVTWGNGCRDTVKKNTFIKVSGPVVSVTGTNYNDCLPLTTNYTSSVVVNFNYKNVANNNITYNWSIDPPGPFFSNSQAANTQIVINNDGEYNVQLIIENGSGCRDTVKEQRPIYAGLKSDFEFSKDIVCEMETITTTPQSLYKPDRFQWISNPPGPIFSPSSTIDNPEITFPDSGKYLISQVVSKRNTCFDTLKTLVTVVKTVADFYSEDTLNYCAPVNVTFKDNSLNADELVWSFGDGKTLTTPDVDSILHIYFENSSVNGFDIKLKAINKLGCADSITRFGYIRIDGPVPDFKINILKGCEPLTVNIVDNSTSYSEYYFDYGDGSAFDTTGNPGNHTYTTDNSNNEISKFKPSLFLIDPLGCFSEAKFPLDIEVYKQPVIKFTADTLMGCLPLTVNFTDSSKFVQEYQWDFDNNGFVNDTTKNPSFTYSSPGLKTVKLRARSQYGCINFDSIIDYISVYDLPFPAFATSRGESDTAQIFYDFTNQSTNYNTIEWFADTASIGSQNSFSYGFRDSGLKRIKLIATTLEGCIDSADTLIRVTPDFFFHIPNAFTPNGEGGNEKFGPVTPPWARRYVMRIFNRYGQLLFETDDVKEYWDGNFRNTPAQDGVYIYSIEYLDIIGKSHVYQGTFLLIR